MLVGDMISSTAFRFPHRTGIVDEHGMRLTWQQMDSRINSLAHAFIEMGIKRQETVAMLAENCAQYAEFLFAAAKSNTIAAGLNYRLTPEQLLIQIDDCRPKAIIVQKKYAELIEPIISRLKEVKVFIGFGEGHRFEHDYETLIKKFPATEPDVEIDENDIHTITYTSGTTGAPKAVVVTHRTQVARAIQMNFALRFTPEETIISSLPMYAFGGQMPIFTYTMIGATIVSLVLKGKSLVELTESERVTTHFLTPSRLKMMKDYVAESDREYDLSSVRKVVVSNQAAYEDDLRELVNFFPALEYSGILRGFGSSETGLYFMVLPSNKIAAGFMDGATQKERQRLHSLGKPILFGKVKVVDDSRQPIPAGETGEIVVGGDTVMQGYWNNPEATAEVIEDGWYYTKDLGAFDDDGYLYFRGRKDDMIRSGGVFVAPAEVEEIVLKLSPIQEAAVFGTPHEMWGEAVTAAVVLKPDQSISEAEIRDHCRKHLAGFQIPKTIHFMEALPRDGQSNKVLVTELRRTYGKQ